MTRSKAAKLKSWLPVLVTVVLAILGAAFFVNAKLAEHGADIANLKNSVGELKDSMGRMETRIERLNELRTDLSRRLLREEFSQAILTQKPVQLGDRWVSYVHVIDPRTQYRFTYEKEVSGPDDTSVLSAVASVLKDPALDAVSFNKIETATSDLPGVTPIEAPTGFDPKASAVLRTPQEEREDLIRRLSSVLVKDPIKTADKFEAKTIPELAKELKRRDTRSWMDHQTSKPHWQTEEDMRRDDEIRGWTPVPTRSHATPTRTHTQSFEKLPMRDETPAMHRLPSSTETPRFETLPQRGRTPRPTP